MQNSLHMEATFERNKNLKASAYTLGICGALFFLFFFLQWSLPQIPPPPADEGIEVNLGNSETGLGDIAPQSPGDPSAAQQDNAAPAQQVNQQQAPNIQGDVNADEDAPVVNNTKPVPVTKPVTNPNIPHKKIHASTISNPTPAPPKPKAVFKGGTSTTSSGNGADSYNNVRNQGIAGGQGDQGNPNGNPNSDSYTGNAAHGNSGVSIRNGLAGRYFTKLPSFEDDFNEPAKVAVDITVDQAGNVVQAYINPRGTTTTNPNIRAIAIRKAKQLKLNAGKDDTQNGTIVFDFKLRG